MVTPYEIRNDKRKSNKIISLSDILDSCMKFSVYNILFYSLGVIFLISCSSKQVKAEAEQEAELTFSTYENEFYSFQYPSYWEVAENIRDKAEGFEEYEGNEKMTLQQHEVDLINYDGLSFHVVRSNFHFDLPVKDYADISILSKGLASAGEYQDDIDYNRQKDANQYLGFWRNDSITFANHDAVLLAFEVVTPANDTLIQKQIVVQNGKGDTFYVNSTFQYNDEIADAIGNAILETFKLK